MTEKEQRDLIASRITRRTFLKATAAIGAAGLGAPLLPPSRAWAAGGSGSPASIPIKHVIVSCQENRSFDHYYGFASFAGSYGVPAGYSQPDGHGGSVTPYHFTSLTTSDIGHSWNAVHGEWDS